MLTVDKFMTLDPYTVQPDSSLREVLMIMKVEGLRQLPVVDEANKLLGIVTDRDIRLAMNSPFVGEHWLEETLLDNTMVRQCMTTSVISVSPDTPAHEAAEMLSVYKFGGLPVVNDGILVGIISVTDFLDFFATTWKPRQQVGHFDVSS